MNAVENIKEYIREIRRADPHLSREQIESLGKDLVKAAETRDGYEGIVWQAGVHLLNAYGSAGNFYQRFGYQTVANALHATFVNGDFPLALGFIVSNFLPSDGLHGLVEHASINQALATLDKEQFRIPIQNFLALTPEFRKAALLFLNAALASGLTLPHGLQISSSLLIASINNPQEYEPSLRLFLDLLLEDDRDINLLYCWRAAIEIYPSLANEANYLNILYRTIERCKELGDKGIPILEQLLNDKQLILSVPHDSNLLLFLGLAEWWLYVNKNCRVQELLAAWQMIWNLKESSPALHKALRWFLENDQQTALPEGVEHLEEFQRVMRILREKLRLRTYRGVPLAIGIFRHNLIHIFEPLYESLESSSALSNQLIEQIRALDATALIDENPLQKQSRFQRVIGDLRSKMIEDHKVIIQLLQEALRLRLRLSGSSNNDSLSTEEVQSEVNELCLRCPNLRWAIEWFLPETVKLLDRG